MRYSINLVLRRSGLVNGEGYGRVAAALLYVLQLPARNSSGVADARDMEALRQRVKQDERGARARICRCDAAHGLGVGHGVIYASVRVAK